MLDIIGLFGLVLVIFLLLSVLGRGARAGQQLRILRRLAGLFRGSLANNQVHARHH